MWNITDFVILIKDFIIIKYVDVNHSMTKYIFKESHKKEKKAIDISWSC